MITKSVLTAVAMTALPACALAQGFSGGELTLDTYAFENGDDPTGVNYSAALEYAINRNISIAGDVSVYDYSLLDDSITTVTVHGIYHLNGSTSLGAFIGKDSANNRDAMFFGLEGGFETGKIGVEGYFALYDNDDSSNVLGVSGEYELTQTVSAIATIGVGDVNDASIRRISAGAEYEFNAGPSVYAEIGNVNGGGTDSSYIGLGASIEFGAARGTTFDRRGVFETINPGF